MLFLPTGHENPYTCVRLKLTHEDVKTQFNLKNASTGSVRTAGSTKRADHIRRWCAVLWLVLVYYYFIQFLSYLHGHMYLVFDK